MNVIEFRPVLENTYFIEPKPAIESLPDWYKNSKTFLDNKKYHMLFPTKKPTITYKKCAPFLDALSFGYLIFLNHDLYVDQTGESEYYIQWRIPDKPPVGSLEQIQIRGMQIDTDTYSSIPYRWHNMFHIKTKPGYSCLITHPLNRLDLPFMTLSGVVDTDKHGIDISFPFLLKNNFNGIIERGTPIAQVIPFKRQNWKMKFGNFYKENIYKTEEFLSYATNGYKKLSWSRKSYR